MKKIITVCIVDTDRFFALGVKLILIPYFEHLGQVVLFVDAENAAGADLVICSACSDMPIRICRTRWLRQNESPVYIVVRSTQEGSLSERRCLYEQGNLWRGASPQSLLALVEKELKDREGAVISAAKCHFCTRMILTQRELEVMRCMTREMAPKSLTRYLNLSPKTVSAHKRAVMRKLGFKRNEELYHWLRSGGLEQIKRSLS